MSAILDLIIGPFLPYISAAFGLIGAFFFGRSGGKKAERLKSAQNDQARANEIEEKADASRDVDIDDPAGRLHSSGHLRD